MTEPLASLKIKGRDYDRAGQSDPLDELIKLEPAWFLLRDVVDRLPYGRSYLLKLRRREEFQNCFMQVLPGSHAPLWISLKRFHKVLARKQQERA